MSFQEFILSIGTGAVAAWLLCGCASVPVEKTHVVLIYDCKSERCVDHAKETFDACSRRRGEDSEIKCGIRILKGIEK
jgi:hypothetical protein